MCLVLTCDWFSVSCITREGTDQKQDCTPSLVISHFSCPHGQAGHQSPTERRLELRAHLTLTCLIETVQ